MTIDAESLPFLFDDDLQIFDVGMHYGEHVAYLPVGLLRETTRGRGEHAVTETRAVLAYVTSDHRLIPAEPDALRADGLVVVGELPTHDPPPLDRFKPSTIRAWVEGTAQPPNPGDLFRRVREHFETRVDPPDKRHPDLWSLWTIGTYLHRLFDAYPYLEFVGTKDSGKTKTGRVIALDLAFNGIETANATPASIYFEVEAHGACVLLDDQEDLAGKDERSQDLRSLLNVGYKRGAVTRRGDWKAGRGRRFAVFGPKLITSINGTNDVLGTRCIRQVMQPSLDDRLSKTSEDLGARFWRDDRDKLLLWTLSEWESVRICYRRQEIEGRQEHRLADGRSFGDLRRRSWEVWKPIITLAEYFETFGRIEGLTKSMVELALDDETSRQGDAAETSEGLVLTYLLSEPLTQKEDGTKVVEVRPNSVALGLNEQGGRFTAPRVGYILRAFGWRRYKRKSNVTIYDVPLPEIRTAAQRRNLSLSSLEAPKRPDPPKPPAMLPGLGQSGESGESGGFQPEGETA